MRPIITVEDVTRWRVADPRAAQLVRDKQVSRDTAAMATGGTLVYVVAGETVLLDDAPGGYLATHDCPDCAAGRPCFRALAAVDAEGAERYIAHRDALYATRVRAGAR